MSEITTRENGAAWAEDPNDVEKLGDFIREGIPHLLREFTDVEQVEEDGTLAIWPYETNVGWRAKWSNGMEVEITIKINTPADAPFKCEHCGVELDWDDIANLPEGAKEVEACGACYEAEFLEEPEEVNA